MKAFAFRLQVVLDRALDEEETEVRRLGELQHALAALEGSLGAVRAERREETRHLAAAQCVACEPHLLHERYLYLNALATHITELEDERTRQQQAVDTQRDRVTVAMRKRQTLERLKEKAHTEYRREEQRYELAAMEESVLPRLARAKMERV